MTTPRDPGDGAFGRRAFVAQLLRSGAAVRLAPAFAAAATLGAPSEADAGAFDSPHARATMAAFADAVIPPDPESPGGAEVGFVDVLYDPGFYEVFTGFRVPIAPAIRLVVADLDRRALFRVRKRFASASAVVQDELLEDALGGRLRLVYEGLVALVKIVYFGGQRDTAGWDVIGYGGPADAHPDASPAGPAPAPPMTDDGNPP